MDKNAQEAAEILSDALSVHDELEKYYIDAIEFEKLSRFSAKLVKRIKAM